MTGAVTSGVMDALIGIVSQNAYVVLMTFALSLFANVIQISTYLRDRRRLRQEAIERQQLLAQLDKYQYLIGLAERTVKTEEELQALEEDVRDWRVTAKEIENRVAQMRQVAERKMAEDAVTKSVHEVVDAYEGLTALRRTYAALGPLPNIPPSVRAEIEREVSEAITMPYELPKAFVFRALLLLLIGILLPWPVNTVIALLFLHVFFALFFEAAKRYSDTKLTGWICRHADAVGRASAMSLWYVLLNFVQNIIAIPVQDLFGHRYTWSLAIMATVSTAVIGGMLHWRAVRRDALSPLLENESIIPVPA